MLTKFKTYKALNESFGGAFNLGLKTPKSIGFVGSKLSEIGLKPEDMENDDDAMALLGDDEDGENQDPSLDDAEGDEGDEGLDALGDDEGGEDDDMGIDDFGGDEDLARMLGGEGGDEDGDDDMGGSMGGGDLNGMTGSLGGAMDGMMGGEGEGDDDYADPHADILAALSAQDYGSDGMPAGAFGDDDTDLSGVGDGGAGLDSGDESEFGDLSGMFGGEQGPGAPDFGEGDEEGDEDGEEGDEEEGDEEGDDDEETSDAENAADKGEKESAKAFALKKSKKFMDKGETAYSKKFMCNDKNESTDLFESLISMGRGEVRKKFSSGVLKNEEAIIKPAKPRVARQAQPGEVGYAPTGRVGANFPSIADYNESGRQFWHSLANNGDDDVYGDEGGNDKYDGHSFQPVSDQPEEDPAAYAARVMGKHAQKTQMAGQQAKKKAAVAAKLGSDPGYSVADGKGANLGNIKDFRAKRMQQAVAQKLATADPATLAKVLALLSGK